MSHILVVEPDRALAHTIKTYLQKTSTVIVAHDAQSAIISADERRPNVVILELAMADHNGIAFLEEFRSYVDWQAVPIIIYSQIPREDTGLSEQEWAKSGIPSYLYKSTATLANLSHAIKLVLPNYETA